MNSPNNTIYNLFKNKIYYSLLIVCSISFNSNSQEIDPNGFNQFFYENGTLASEGEFKNGLPEGIWKSYYVNGELKSQGKKIKGESDSLWNFYDQEGRIESSFDYAFDKKNGCAIVYDTLGNIIEEYFYLNDVIQGDKIWYYESGKIKKSVSFENGKEVGTFYEYDESGTIITIEIYDNGFIKDRQEYNRFDKNGNKTGMWREFFANGNIKTEGAYQNGEKNGVFKEYDKKGKLIDINRIIGDSISGDTDEFLIIEVYKQYHPNGKVKLMGGFANGLRSGIFREYNIEGELVNGYLYEKDTMIAEGMIEFDGSYSGDWIEYYKQGQIKSEGKYEGGNKTGMWIYYYSNGKKEQVGGYTKNLSTGKWMWYYQNGTLKRNEYFNKKGKLNGLVTEYDSLGKEITRGEYYNDVMEGEWFYNVGDYKEVGRYTLGLRDGIWNFYYLNGRLAFTGLFDEGEAKGKHVYYFKSGLKRTVGKYLGGEKHGNWKTYNERGEEIEIIQYKRGVIYKVNGFRVKEIKETQ